jgi:hypothetical protein
VGNPDYPRPIAYSVNDFFRKNTQTQVFKFPRHVQKYKSSMTSLKSLKSNVTHFHEAAQ